jgi:ClpP class serine protease
MSFWLLSPEVRALISEARRNIGAHAAAATAWEAEALAKEQRETEARDGQTLPRGLTIAGATAEIRVDGVLTKRPDFFAMFFGGGNTTYTGIRNALAVAATDPNVKTIVLGIDSPGGSVDGLFETLDAIAAVRASGKTIRVRAENAQSAAYGIAAVAGPIEAVSRAATFGSIGTAVSFFVDPDVVTLTNTDSPKKRPDVTTDAGKAVVVEYLDQINDEFVRAIARGRDVAASTITRDYGQGASFTAPNAHRLGMIDKIATTPPRAVNSKGSAMATRQDDNPDESRALAAASEAAVARGVTQERDRVLAHLTLGESCGDMSIALEAIRSGATMTQELTARYLSAGMNRSDRGKRQTESNDAERVVAGAGASSAETDLGDLVVANLTGSDRSFIRA